MIAAPVVMSWDGEVMRPATPFMAKKADEIFVIGLKYPLVVHEDRSMSSHNFYFANLAEAFSNLPHDLEAEYPTFEHFRAKGLIRTGHRDERVIFCETPELAQLFAAFIRPKDDYAIISVNDCTVVEWTAKSQSRKAMGAKEFQASKRDVLSWAWALVGVDPETAAANSGRVT